MSQFPSREICLAGLSSFLIEMDSIEAIASYCDSSHEYIVGDAFVARTFCEYAVDLVGLAHLLAHVVHDLSTRSAPPTCTAKYT